MIIAVDGPAASGKGTIARALARHYGLPHLDTGLLYRAVGIEVLRHGGDPENVADALAACGFDNALLDDAELRTEIAGAAASRVSAIPAVRAALVERQRAFARQPGGAVLDGRDIGTVIAPDANAKLYVLASDAVRAQRRFAELSRLRPDIRYEKILDDIRARDLRDSTRSVAPLRPADDAALLDTSEMDIEAAVNRAISLVEAQIGVGRQATR